MCERADDSKKHLVAARCSLFRQTRAARRAEDHRGRLYVRFPASAHDRAGRHFFKDPIRSEENTRRICHVPRDRGRCNEFNEASRGTAEIFAPNQPRTDKSIHHGENGSRGNREWSILQHLVSYANAQQSSIFLPAIDLPSTHNVVSYTELAVLITRGILENSGTDRCRHGMGMSIKFFSI